MKHPEWPFAVVVWDDAVGDMSGQAHEIQHHPERCQTYGWVLRSDDVGVTVASDWVAKTDTYRSITFIPRGMVIEERRSALVKPRSPKSKPSGTSSSSSPSSRHSSPVSSSEPSTSI